MKVITDIEQGTIAWKEIKWAKIGGSSAKDLLVKNLENSALFHRICGEMCEEFGDFEEGYTSADMQRGNELEPYARKKLEDVTGIEFNVPAWIQSDIDILGISPDGVNKLLTIGCEFKCPSSKVYNEYLCNNRLLVDKYAPQIADYFAVIPQLEKVYMCAFRPEHMYKQIIIVEVTREFLFNNGTAAKEKMYSIGELAEDIKVKAIQLEEMCKKQIDKYKF